MASQEKSLCPINLALEVFGDRWSLLGSPLLARLESAGRTFPV